MENTKDVIMMIAEILASLAIVGSAIFFIVRWCFDMSKRVSKIEDKIDNLPIEIENRMIRQLLPFAGVVINQPTNPLPPDEIARMKRLMKKLQDNSITIVEGEELKRLLEVEKEEAEEKNNATTIRLKIESIIIIL